MNLFTRLARNSLWLLVARIGAQGSMVIVTYLLARRLGTSDFGEYAFIATAIMIGNTLTTFGSDMYLIREIAAKSEFSELMSVLILQLTLSCLFIGFVLWFAQYLPNQTPESVLALKVYSFALIPLAFFTVFTSVLRGAQRMTAYAWLNFALPIFQVISISVFIQRETRIVTLAYLLLIIQIAGAVLGGIFCSSIFPGFWKGLHFSFDKMISLFVACLPIALIAILGIVYQKLSLAMLSLLGTSSMAGLFSAAARVVEAARIGHFSVFTALYPAMACASSDKDPVKVFRFSWFLLLGIACVEAVFIFLLAKPVVNIFFGVEYQLSIPVLKILAYTLIPYTINSFLSLAFLAKKQEKIVVLVFAVSLLILLTLNLFFIPLAGQAGASWAILIAEVVQAVLFLLAWMINPFHQVDVMLSKGVSYELSDLS